MIICMGFPHSLRSVVAVPLRFSTTSWCHLAVRKAIRNCLQAVIKQAKRLPHDPMGINQSIHPSSSYSNTQISNDDKPEAGNDEEPFYSQRSRLFTISTYILLACSWWCILKSCIFIIQSILLLRSSIWRCGSSCVFRL